MKNELSTKLVEVIGSIQTGVAKASDFAVEQLPDIAQQYIMFGRVGETSYFAAYIILATITIRISVIKFKKMNSYYFPWPVFLFFGGILSMISAFFTLQSVVMVWFAPKIYLIKGLAGLLK